jgi:adenine-specific DNA methylase
MNLPKRLIEVDLPIKRISAHARREKSIRHGHISTLHIWWARRPLAACRAVICAALWPDPVDVKDEDVAKAKQQGRDLQLNTCPPAFREKARELMREWATRHLALASAESFPHFNAIAQDPRKLNDNVELRKTLLDFIADFANFDNSTVHEYLDTSRALTQSAHESLGGAAGTRPLVVDPFAGGGSIPLEALRVGADVFASDLNPVPVLLNKLVLEYIPKYGQRLAEEVSKWGEWIEREAEKELAKFYPNDTDGATPIAYHWARTIQCEGPGCGAEVPLIRSLWLAKKANRSIALQLVPNKMCKRVDFQIIVKQRDGWVDQANPKHKIENPNFDGTVKRGSATCPCCGYTTPVAGVREQIKVRLGGTGDARLMCVVNTKINELGRHYRLPTSNDEATAKGASAELKRREQEHRGKLSLVPNEATPASTSHRAVASVSLYGLNTWAELYAPRQAVALTSLVRLIGEARNRMDYKNGFADAVQVCLALIFGRVAALSTGLCRWSLDTQCVVGLFGRQAIPMVWNYAESVVTSNSAGSWGVVVERFPEVISAIGWNWAEGVVQKSDATENPLPSDSAQAVLTDPPYYDAVPYAEVSDFFYVWLKRNLPFLGNDILSDELTPKNQQAIVWHPNSSAEKAEFERKMRRALQEARRVIEPRGIGVVVFAHKSTAGWEAQLSSMIEAGWVVTASWPIDTECESRFNAMGTASLASSVHLVCRPRENPDGSLRTDEIGDWRDVLRELPRRIHEWMPRLAEEGIVGADAIFACLGPALEIFSRYSRVEKASGEAVTLKEYLEQVWAAVAKEALSMVFEGADATGFEEDARLTAMWLWTLSPGPQSNNSSPMDGESVEEEASDDEEDSGKAAKSSGFVLEYDAARKIAQGLGAHLEELFTLVEVKGDKARLLPVAERTKYLFGKGETDLPTGSKKKKAQPKLFQELDELAVQAGWGPKGAPTLGETTLDRIHQSMILFAAGRSEAMRRFLVEDGAGSDERFWRLANALSALYPANGDEKRWVDGVLAKKKSFGF